MSVVIIKDRKKLQEIIEQLLELQKVNQNLDKLVKEIEMLRGQTLLEERKYDTKKFQYNKNLPFLQKAEAEYSVIKTEIDEISSKIDNCEEKKKKIKTIKEFKALNREIDFLSQQNAIKENDFLNKGEEVEFKKEKIDKILESLKEVEMNFEEKKQELDTLKEARKSNIKAENTNKEKIEQKINPKIVKIFDKVYKNKNGLALTTISKNVCQGCFTLTPRQIEIDIHEQETLIYCPFCSRIIYLDTTEEDEKSLEEVELA